jgi:colicin import membrane protein
MKVPNAFRSAAAVMLAASLGACGSAPQVAPEVAVPPSQSVAQADQRLASVARERAAIAAAYAQREHECYQKFLVNNCLAEAKERRRLGLLTQRAFEIEAARYKRQAAVDERDRAIAKAETEMAAEEARLAAEPPAPPRQVSDVRPPRPKPVASRIAQHNEKLKQAEAREKADAGKRAANVRAFERRKRQSEERQKDVAARLAEKKAKAAGAKQQGAAATPAAPPATLATPPAAPAK